jgi:choline kinase
LVPVRGKPLILHSIEALASAGITKIAVVVGYRASNIMAELGDGSRFGGLLEYVFNPDYRGGNALSVQKIRRWASGEPFVLCMGDHLIEPGIISRLLEASPLSETLCVDFSPKYCHKIGEATKVVVDHAGYIRWIGKELTYWDAIDTGVFLLTEKFVEAVDELIAKRGLDMEISDVIRFLVRGGHRFATSDVTGSFWVDVDTEEDLDFVTA